MCVCLCAFCVLLLCCFCVHPVRVRQASEQAAEPVEAAAAKANDAGSPAKTSTGKRSRQGKASGQVANKGKGKGKGAKTEAAAAAASPTNAVESRKAVDRDDVIKDAAPTEESTAK